MGKFIIKVSEKLSISQLEKFLNDDNAKVELSQEAKNAINNGRKYLEEKLKKSKKPIYGINTGFGSLCNVKIPDNELETLQNNLIISHACGFGKEADVQLVKLMLFLKVQSLSYGHSGVQLSTVQRLVDFINRRIFPVVYTQGSLGASGDLAPLAHLSLPLIEKGKVWKDGKIVDAKKALNAASLKIIHLKSKEGLALLNGTQFMSAYAVYNLIKAKSVSKAADVISCLSLEAFDCRPEPFKEHIHLVRPHKGQIQTAKNITSILKGSKIFSREKTQVQDPYSFRCIPQVHGASKDTIDYVTTVVETEINSVTDNPTIFPKEDDIISGGNFHGQPLALALDFLAIAVSELASISERRTYLLISGQRNLPPFLMKEAGLNSGFMIPQYTAASIVSQNKQLCTPASVDSIVSSNGQEDHVSMGANAATKCLEVVLNTERVLAIELFTSAQAFEFETKSKSSSIIELLYKNFRKVVPFIKKDTYMHEEMAKSLLFVQNNNW
ncbi:MAG: histidine ammonia-lyase [Bacteroidia bacterium]